MNERLSVFMKNEGLTPAQLAQKINVQPSSISHILSGRNKPSFDFIYKIVQSYPSLNIEWLITGKGQTYKKSETAKQTATLFDQPDTSEKKINSEKEKPQKDSADNIPDNDKAENQIRHSQKDNSNFTDKTDKDKMVERIVIFYSDKTFSEYFPS
mgnify:CR=1 FL=1